MITTNGEYRKHVEDKVYSYPTKSEYGFTWDEILDLLDQFKGINMDRFNNAMLCNTCMIVDDKVINCPIDVYRAVVCGVEDRPLNSWEFD